MIRSLGFGALTALAVLSVATTAFAGEPRIVVSIKPVHALVASVARGVATPILLVRGAASPHTYSMKPSDAAALASASIVFRIGPELETFLDKPLKGVRAPVVDLMNAPGVELLDAREGGTWEPHDHGHEHGHDHEAGEREVNAHVWLDPVNAEAMTKTIAAELTKVDPAHADAYAKGAEATIRDLTALDAELRTMLNPVRDRPFVVFHDAYQYLEHRYGLNAVGSITVSPDRKPSAKRLSAIRAKLRGLGAACVFAEPQFEPALIDTVIEGSNAKRSKLDPEGATLEEGPDLLTALLKNNARALVDCLK